MLLQYGITRAKTRSKSGRSYKMYPRPLNEPYISPKTPTTGKKFFVGVDVSARHAYSDRVPPLPTEAFCESSCAYKTSLHYQGTNPCVSGVRTQKSICSANPTANHPKKWYGKRLALNCAVSNAIIAVASTSTSARFMIGIRIAWIPLFGIPSVFLY